MIGSVAPDWLTRLFGQPPEAGVPQAATMSWIEQEEYLRRMRSFAEAQQAFGKLAQMGTAAPQQQRILSPTVRPRRLQQVQMRGILG